MHRIREHWALVILFVVAVVLRLYGFRHGEPPHFLEIIPSLDALLPFGQYILSPQLDLCPPLYYLILKPLTFVGTSLWLMRMPSLVLGALTPLVAYLVLHPFAGKHAAFLGALLLACSPLHQYYSQQAQPGVFAALACGLTFGFYLHLKRDHRLRSWLLYDASLLALLFFHREAAFAGVSFLLLHLVRLWWFHTSGPRLRRRVLPSLRATLFHHFLVAVLALPWLAIMPTRSEWYEPKPLWRDFLLVPLSPTLFGVSTKPNLSWIITGICVAFILFPAMKHILAPKGGVGKSALLYVVLVLGLPFFWSFSGRTRFNPATTTLLALVPMLSLLGSLIAHSRPLVRLASLAYCFAAVIFGLIAQWRRIDTPPYAEVAAAIERHAPPHSVIVTLPDFADRMSAYFLGDRYEILSASKFFETWGEVKEDQIIYFACYQFPSSDAAPYTFYGALTQFSRPTILYRNRLNLAARAEQIQLPSLRLWFDDPETLNIVDQPSSATLYMFYPGDKVFSGPEFITNFPAMEYEQSGQRCVWLRREVAPLSLNVSLDSGKYVLRLHGSPHFECSETGERRERSVDVALRLGEEQVRVNLTQEGIIELPFEIETEVKQLNLILGVDKIETVECPQPMKIGLKIYSLAIDAAQPHWLVE